MFSSIQVRYDDDDFNDYNEGFSGYNDVDYGVRIGVLIGRFLRYSCIFKMDNVQFYHHSYYIEKRLCLDILTNVYSCIDKLAFQTKRAD